MSKHIIFFGLFFVFSCRPKFMVETDESGHECRYELNEHGQKEGKVYCYYADGTLHSESYFKNGKKEGEMRTFDSTGRLMEIENYRRGLLYGLQTSYSYKDNIQLYVIKTKYILIENEEYQTHSIGFNFDHSVRGQMITGLIFRTFSDTVTFGNKMLIEMELRNNVGFFHLKPQYQEPKREWDSLEVHYGDFDEDFVLKGKENVVEAHNTAQIKFYPTQLGWQVLRGYVKDITPDRWIKKRNPLRSKPIHKKYYFEYQYFVKAQ